ncbi:MAG: hypothetical protein ABW067_07900 [Rhizobacter sp.]
MKILMTVLLIATSLAALLLWRRQQALQREAWIRSFEFPHGLFAPLRERHADLSLKDCQLVAHALRQFFLAHLHSGRKYVSMPSQIADELWHEFILHTRNYEVFCRKAFGRFMHHTPAVTLGAQRHSNAGLRRCFWFACRDENINPRQPSRLPLLFAIDAKLKVPGGHVYVADCSGVTRDGTTVIHCGGEFSSSSHDGGTDGFGDTRHGSDAGADSSNAGSDDGGSSSSDGGGCGGGGCGGGGGGD